MGRIKTQLVKRVTKKLVKEHKAELKEDFDGNKEAIAKFANIRNRKIRNKIAGYVTRLVKKKEEV